MSNYENYESTSNNYDLTRAASGIEIILGYLANLPRELSNLTILDAGCGTGNYTLPLLPKIEKAICVDLSLNMLQHAKQKFEQKNLSNYQLVNQDLGSLTFESELFDAILCNQSLHHLDTPREGFPKLTQFLTQASHSLKSDGLLIINTITHKQLRDGVWWGELIKPAVNRMSERFITIEALKNLLNKLDLSIKHTVVPTDIIIQEKGYFDPNSLYNCSFRDGDSHFSLLTESELSCALEKLSNLIKTDGFSEYFKKREKLRHLYGQFTFLIIEKQKEDSNNG